MYLSNLKLWNFRKFGSVDELDLERPDLEVPFKMGLNVLIGENDSGKTAIIDAIKLVLKTHSYEWIRLEQEDFYNEAERLRIECRFDGLSDMEAKNFTEWLGMEGEGVKAQSYLRVILDASQTTERVLPFDIRAGTDDEGYSLNAGAKEFLKTTFLKPLRDAKTELIPKRSSRLSQILRGHPTFKDKDEDHDLVDLFGKFSGDVEDYFNDPLKDGKKVKTDIERFLTKFFGKKRTANFSITDKKLTNILETLKLTLEDEKLGLGSHNLLFIAAELLNLERVDWTGLRLGLIEEAEAHLHPQAQLRVVEFLQKEASDEGIQIILTTHSPNLGSKVELKHLIICTADRVFPMGSKFTKLEQPDYKFLERFLDVTKANLFFAKGIILVEGWAEELLIPALADNIGINLASAGVSVVNVANTAFLRYAKVFQREDGKEIDVPVSVITDIDIKPDKYKEIDHEETTEQDADMDDIKIQKKAKYEGQKVKVFVSSHWTLEYCLGLNEKISPLLFESVKAAGQEMYEDGRYGKRVSQTYQQFSEGKNQQELAFHLYYDFIWKGKNISKTIIAQQLAERLKGDQLISREDLAQDDNIGYLIEAIEYASGLDTNK